jgi:CBS domain-containing protein/uncharacterized protein (DUF2267 family)
MSLERYCRDRLVVLKPDHSAYEAARAMDHNHVGALVVQEGHAVIGIVTDRDLALAIVGADLPAHETLVYEIMSLDPVTVSIDDNEGDALEAMERRRVRRAIILDRGHLAGIVTLDDLLLSGAADLDDLQRVISAQLLEPSAGKPWGELRPTRQHRRGDGEQRREAHRENTLHHFVRRLMRALDLEDEHMALDAFEVVASNIARRLMPREAHAFTSQLPALLRERLLDLPAGPDRRITRRLIIDEMADRLDVDYERAADIVHRVSRAMGELVSAGELEDARGQLPTDMKQLLQPSA